MESVNKSDLTDKFIECSALTSTDVMGGWVWGGGVGFQVGGVGKESFFCRNYCFCVLLMLLAILGKLGSNLIILLLFC